MSKPAQIVLLYVTAPDRKTASLIATTLVSERLVACANIIEGMTSICRWKGKVQGSKETILMLKTTTKVAKRATKRIEELHPYECPCILAFICHGGSESYCSWVRDSVIV